jgi:hypothetical protein
MNAPRLLPALAVLAVLLMHRDVAAQPQVTVRAPAVSVRNSFFEQSGVRWQVNGPGFFARFGGGAGPPFGNFTPGAGVSGGFGFGGGGFSGNLGFDFSQGASRSIVSTTPMLTGTVGFPMSLQAGVYRPFVTGFVPVVGPGGGFGYVSDYYGTGYGPLPMMVPYRPPVPQTVAGLRARELGLGRGNHIGGLAITDSAPAVNGAAPQQAKPRGLIDPVPPTRAEREQRQAAAAAERDAKALGYFERGREAEEAGKASTARIYYQMAARRADGEFRREITERLRALD